MTFLTSTLPCPQPQDMGSCYGKQGLPAVGLTVVSSQEGGLVHIVLGVEGLSVQDCGRGDLSIGCVDVQPVGRVRQLRVPMDGRPEASSRPQGSSPSQHPGAASWTIAWWHFCPPRVLRGFMHLFAPPTEGQQWLMSLWWVVLESGELQGAVPASPKFCRWVGTLRYRDINQLAQAMTCPGSAV